MFDLKFWKTNLADYLIMFFLILSYYLYNIEDRIGLTPYYFLLGIVLLILKFHEIGFVKNLGLSFRKRRFSFWIILISSIIISNTILFLIQSEILQEEFEIKKYFDVQYLYVFLVFNSLRIFGEELIFRGFLLIKEIREKNSIFWLLNFTQATLFALIHSLFIDEVFGKLVFTAYVFVFSVLVGWLNRKFSSMLPSWLIHLGNGIQNFLFGFI